MKLILQRSHVHMVTSRCALHRWNSIRTWCSRRWSSSANPRTLLWRPTAHLAHQRDHRPCKLPPRSKDKMWCITWETCAWTKWIPLSRSFAFRFRGDADPHKLLEDPVVGEIAKKHQLSPAQVGEMCSVCVARVCFAVESVASRVTGRSPRCCWGTTCSRAFRSYPRATNLTASCRTQR